MEFEYTPIKDMPFDIKYPKDYEEWIRKTLPARIFYDRFKKVMHCTRCGYTGEYEQKIRKKDRVTCPHCGETFIAQSHTTPRWRSQRTTLHFWKTKKAIYYAEVWAVWDYRYKHDTSEEIWKAIDKSYSQTREQEETVSIIPLSIGRITRNAQQAWERRWNYNGRWSEGKYSMDEQSTPHLVNYQDGNWMMHPNTKKLLSKTFLGPSEFRNIHWPSQLIKELMLHAKYPAAEYVVKAGLGEYIDNTIESWSRTYIRPNGKAKTSPGFLRLSAQDVDKLRKWDQLTIEGIAYYKKLKKYRQKPQLEDLQLLKKWIDIGYLYSGRINGDPVKTARYFEKQNAKGKYSYSDQLVNLYVDYERMLNALGYPADDDYYRYPKDLREAHDKAVDEYNEHLKREAKRLKREAKRQLAAARQKKLEEERAFIEGMLPKLQKYNMQDDKYLIRALESVEDFKREGINNHNCVGTYADRAMKGKAKIFVLRKVDAPEISFVTIELALDEKSIKQCYETGNRIPDEEVIAWVDHWLKKVVNGKNRKKRKAA